jgi:hypothetical protein
MTSTALQIHTGEPGSAPARLSPIGEFGMMMDLARELVPTGFLPDHIKTPGQCVAIILQGRELGMEPMRALRSLSMVKGKVVENADSQLARFKDEGGRAAFLELDDKTATLALRHPNGDEHTESFTMVDAKAAGLLGSGMYAKYPKAMLRSRCITAGLKSLGWSGAVGNYDPDEAAAFTPSAPARVEGEQRADPTSRPTTSGPAASDTAAATANSVSRDDGEMTLARALELPLMGRAESWANHGTKPLKDCPDKVLKQARHFFRDKVAEGANPRMEEQLAAIALVMDDREKNSPQESLPLAGKPVAETPAPAAAPAPAAEEKAAEQDEPFELASEAQRKTLKALLANELLQPQVKAELIGKLESQQLNSADAMAQAIATAENNMMPF